MDAGKTVARRVFWTGCALLLGCVVLQWPLAAVFHRTDLHLYDIFTAAQKPETSLGRTIIVDIDDLTLDVVGQWPWPRYTLAALLERVQEGNPECVVLDMLLPESDRTSPQVIRERYREDFGIELDFAGLPPGLDDNDAYLAAVLSETPSLGSIFLLHNFFNATSAPRLAPLRVDNASRLPAIPVAAGVLGNTPQVQAALAGAGFINTLKDPDGVLRRFFMLYSYDGDFYPHIMLAVLLRMLHADRVDVRSTVFGPELRLMNAENRCVGRIPVENDSSALLRFNSGLGAQHTVSALDVLRGQVAADLFAGKTVLVGSGAAGLNDLHHTPLGAASPGTAIQAVFLDNVLSATPDGQRGPYRWPSWANEYATALSGLLGLVILGLFLMVRPLAATAGSMALLLALPGGSAGLFTSAGLFLPMAEPMATGLFLLLYSLGGAYIGEHRRALAGLRAVARTRQLTLEAMASIAEMRTVENDGHIRRTQQYVRVLAERLRKTEMLPELKDSYIELLFHSAPLHDLGKVAIADAVLFKPGSLTAEEFEAMKQHTRIGFQVIESAGKELDRDHFLLLAAEVALNHHERWDGTGYPQGLAGETIPLSGRIMALADVYDALVSKRVYKDGFSHEKARAIILEGRGTHFDPRVVDAFLAEEALFRHYAATL